MSSVVPVLHPVSVRSSFSPSCWMLPAVVLSLPSPCAIAPNPSSFLPTVPALNLLALAYSLLPTLGPNTCKHCPVGMISKCLQPATLKGHNKCSWLVVARLEIRCGSWLLSFILSRIMPQSAIGLEGNALGIYHISCGSASMPLATLMASLVYQVFNMYAVP